MIQPIEKFKALDGMRFFAALLVFIAHFEELITNYRLPFYRFDNASVLRFGAIGVTIFFVLSGFLISISIVQSLKKGSEHWLRNFYIRRILRIWPLYFAIVIIAVGLLNRIPFFTIPGYDQDYFPYLRSIILFYCFMLPQIPFIFLPNVPYINVLWSIGVEEWFYIFWPLVRFRRVNILKLSIILLLTWSGLKFLALVLHKYDWISKGQTELLLDVLERNRFYCFAIGGAAAYLYSSGSVMFKNFIRSKITQIGALLIMAFWLSPISTALKLTVFMNEVVSIVSAIIILGCAYNLSIYNILRWRLFRYFGRVSYGIYCFHVIVIATLFKIISSGSLKEKPWVFSFVVSFSFTIAVASISYYVFERRFLKLKSKYY